MGRREETKATQQASAHAHGPDEGGAPRLVKIGVLGLTGISVLSLCCLASVAVGLSEAHQLEFFATWASLSAGVACLCRSVIHVVWGDYWTRHPKEGGAKRRGLLELDVLVVANAGISVAWIAVEALQLNQPSPHPPFLLAVAFPVVLTLVAMETVVCTKDTGKRRGTEIVCEGPVGERFRQLFDTSAEDSGIVHKVMRFFRYPNSPKLVSRFACLLVALMFLPVPVHSSATVGSHLNRIIFPPARPLAVDNGAPPRRRSGSSPQEGEGGGRDADGGCAAFDGTAAPRPNREDIAKLFEEAGVREAGCPGPPESVPGEAGVWIDPAHCGSELRSLVVTAPDYLPALVYQQVASFARARGREGVLLGASDRHPVRGGDFYVVDTSLGSYVLIRRRSNGGHGAPSGSGLTCEALGSVNFPYTVVPPGLVELWLQAVEEGEWLFPRSTSPDGEGTAFEFLAEYPAGESQASASCSDALACTLRIGGEVRHSSGLRTYVSVAEITSLAG